MSVRPTTPTPSELNPAPAWLSLEAAGVYLGIHPRTLRRAIERGEVTGYMFGHPRAAGPGTKAVRVKLADVDRWAESRAMPNARTLRKGATA